MERGGKAGLFGGAGVAKTVLLTEMFVAVDEGVLVKTGAEVLVSVRRALGGADLNSRLSEVGLPMLGLLAVPSSVKAITPLVVQLSVCLVVPLLCRIPRKWHLPAGGKRENRQPKPAALPLAFVAS